MGEAQARSGGPPDECRPHPCNVEAAQHHFFTRGQVNKTASMLGKAHRCAIFTSLARRLRETRQIR
jgi:hypothetical protein